MSITDVNTASGLNTCVLFKPSIHKYCKSPHAIDNYCEFPLDKTSYFFRIARLKHGLFSVKTWLLIAFDTAFLCNKNDSKIHT